MGDRQLLGRCGLENLYAHNTTAHNKLSCASSIVFSFFSDLCSNTFAGLLRVSLFIDLECPSDLGTRWRGAFGIYILDGSDWWKCRSTI